MADITILSSGQAFPATSSSTLVSFLFVRHANPSARPAAPPSRVRQHVNPFTLHLPTPPLRPDSRLEDATLARLALLNPTLLLRFAGSPSPSCFPLRSTRAVYGRCFVEWPFPPCCSIPSLPSLRHSLDIFPPAIVGDRTRPGEVERRSLEEARAMSDPGALRKVENLSCLAFSVSPCGCGCLSLWCSIGAEFVSEVLFSLMVTCPMYVTRLLLLLRTLQRMKPRSLLRFR